jgi:hypothetical protein
MTLVGVEKARPASITRRHPTYRVFAGVELFSSSTDKVTAAIKNPSAGEGRPRVARLAAWICVLIAVVELYFATCHEGEEKQITNGLDKAWVRLDDFAISAGTVNARMWKKITLLTSEAVDHFCSRGKYHTRGHGEAIHASHVNFTFAGLFSAIPLLRFARMLHLFSAPLPPLVLRAIELSYAHTQMLFVALLLFAAGCVRVVFSGKQSHILSLGLLLPAVWFGFHILRFWGTDVLGKSWPDTLSSFVAFVLTPGSPSPFRILFWLFLPLLLVTISYASFVTATSDVLAYAANLRTVKGIQLALVFLGVLNGIYVLLPAVIAQSTYLHGNEKLSFVLLVVAASNALLVLLALSQLIIATFIGLNRLLLWLVGRLYYSGIRHNLLLNKKLNLKLFATFLGLASVMGSSFAGVAAQHIKALLNYAWR